MKLQSFLSFVAAATTVVINGEEKSLYRLSNTEYKQAAESLHNLNDVMDQIEILSYMENDTLLIESSLPFKDESSIPYSVLTSHVETEKQAIKSCQESNSEWNTTVESSFFNCFWPMSSIESYLDTLTRDFPSKVSSFPISKTLQGKVIRAYNIHQAVSSTTTTRQKPIIYIQGMLHAREWLSPMTVLYAMTALVNDDSRSTASLLSTFDFVFVPVVNMDGYEHTWASSKNRYWRKNLRRHENNGPLHGVDLNRNYGPTEGFCRDASKNKNSQVYCGTHAFSEPEIAGIEEWMAPLRDVIVGSIDVHTYASSVYYPYDAIELRPIATGMASVINSMHTDMRYGTKRTTTSGTFKDAQYAMYGHRPSFTLELRGSDFVIDPSHIVKSGQENYAGFLYFASQM